MCWITNIKPQINEHLEKLYFLGYDNEDILAILSEENWLQHSKFRYEVYAYGSSEFTLTDLCNIYSFITGDVFGGDAIKQTLNQLFEDAAKLRKLEEVLQ